MFQRNFTGHKCKVKTISRRTCSHNHRRTFAITSIKGLQKVCLLGFGRQACRWSTTHNINDHKWQFGHYSQPDSFRFQCQSGARSIGYSQTSGKRSTNGSGDTCNFIFGLNYFSVKGFGENYTVFTPNSRSMQEQQEEKLFGRMTAEQTAELDAALTGEGDTAGRIRRFMKKHRLPFLATDRSVLNLPAIGKSMTFRLVGITAEGKRILRFDHDRTRRHSPIIDRMGEIYIVENKSVAAYLRQLEKMGEDAEDYASIWGYTHGQTEPRFGLYVYPDFPFGVTDRVSNLELE